MAMKLQISEILNKLKDITGDGAVTRKVEWLQQHDSPTLRMVLQQGFHPDIQYDLPDGDPPYNPNDAPIGLGESSLYAETRKLSYLWLTPSNVALQDLTVAQKHQLESTQAQATQANDTHRDASAAFSAAQTELEAAQTHLVDAKRRLSQAQETLRESHRLAAQTAQAATNADATVRQIQTTLDKVSSALHERKGVVVPATKRTNLPKHRLESLFIQMLESLHADEAKVLLGIKNKTLTKQFAINKTIVKQAFPDLIP